jgi:hypothetical protein
MTEQEMEHLLECFALINLVAAGFEVERISDG